MWRNSRNPYPNHNTEHHNPYPTHGRNPRQGNGRQSQPRLPEALWRIVQEDKRRKQQEQEDQWIEKASLRLEAKFAERLGVPSPTSPIVVPPGVTPPPLNTALTTQMDVSSSSTSATQGSSPNAQVMSKVDLVMDLASKNAEAISVLSVQMQALAASAQTQSESMVTINANILRLNDQVKNEVGHLTGRIDELTMSHKKGRKGPG